MNKAVLIQSSKWMKKGLHFWRKPVPASIKGIRKITFFLQEIYVYSFAMYFYCGIVTGSVGPRLG
jgi:hypothetical protein